MELEKRTIELRPIGGVKPYPHNPRKNDKAVAAVAESIKRFGFNQPIAVDSNGVIVAGHTRYKAAKKLGLKVVPVVVLDDLTPDEIRAYRLADNKVGEKAEWDLSLLDAELKNITDIDMSLFDFDLVKPAEPVYTSKITLPDYEAREDSA